MRPILTSAWENFPHGVVEALAVGTPVIATRTGGVAEVVSDGENGLLVDPGDAAAFAAAVRRYLGDPGCRRGCRSRREAVGRRLRCRRGVRTARVDPRGGGSMKRLLFVARNRYRVPLSPSLRLKWDALARVFEVRVLAASPDSSRGDETFRLRPRTAFDGPRFWLSLPARIRREARAFRPEAIVAQSPFEAAAALLARTGVPVIVELHGDWRTFGRLYGSAGRAGDRARGRRCRHLGRAARREGACRLAVHRAACAARSAASRPRRFPRSWTWRRSRRRPSRCRAAVAAFFIGVLEPYKNIDGLAEAWRLARPNAELRIVGKGTRTDVVAALVREGLATWQPELSTAEVVAALDAASALILPSRCEGMGRVVIEAQLRGRPVLGSNVGGIPISSRTASTGCSSSPTRTRSRPRCGCSTTTTSSPGSPPTRGQRASAGSPRPTSTRSACASWSTS